MQHKIKVMALVAVLGLVLAGCQTPSGYYDPGTSAAGGMLGGAAGGAALGAIIGAATGNPGAGAAIGAATGAAVGGVGGAVYANDQNMSRAAQGSPPPGYGPPQGYSNPPQGYSNPQGFSNQQGYNNPQGYNNSQGYDNSQGHWNMQGNGPSPGYGPSSYSPSGGKAVAIDRASVNPVRVRPGSQVMLTMNYRVTAPRNQPVSVQLVREISKDGQSIDQPYGEPRQVQNGPHTARVAYHIPPDALPGNYVATFRVVSDQGTSERKVNFSVQ
ncbi:MAG: glycine zipper domain-containing protein [Syntrophales bacterium]|nr:glycine zipper domain-containing protein [Syntrophales bacterium]